MIRFLGHVCHSWVGSFDVDRVEREMKAFAKAVIEETSDWENVKKMD